MCRVNQENTAIFNISIFVKRDKSCAFNNEVRGKEERSRGKKGTGGFKEGERREESIKTRIETEERERMKTQNRRRRDEMKRRRRRKIHPYGSPRTSVAATTKPFR